ncbi:MAG TPA: hypothetical protein ENN76_01710 [Euryarchaeota archaeon]|nr:hypothetical protein [Euryarchaeota archaeon]
MRRLVVVTLLVMLLVPVASGDFQRPGVVNKFLTEFETPQLSPGERGTLALALSNPTANHSMENVVLILEIYQYLTVNEKLHIDQIPDTPYFEESKSSEVVVTFPNVLPGETRPVAVTVVTNKKTPHGEYFSQAAYVVRTKLSFEHNNNTFNYQSRGFFQQNEWQALFDETDMGPRINETRVHEMGIDGIIPDTSFGVRKDLPRICFYSLYVGLVVLLSAGYGFYVWENPASFPWLYRKMAAAKGRMEVKRGKKSKDQK